MLTQWELATEGACSIVTRSLTNRIEATRFATVTSLQFKPRPPHITAHRVTRIDRRLHGTIEPEVDAQLRRSSNESPKSWRICLCDEVTNQMQLMQKEVVSVTKRSLNYDARILNHLATMWYQKRTENNTDLCSC